MKDGLTGIVRKKYKIEDLDEKAFDSLNKILNHREKYKNSEYDVFVVDYEDGIYSLADKEDPTMVWVKMPINGDVEKYLKDYNVDIYRPNAFPEIVNAIIRYQKENNIIPIKL